MARNSFPMMKTGGGVLGKLVSVLLVIAVLTFMVRNPGEAVQLVKATLAFMDDVVASLVNILQQFAR